MAQGRTSTDQCRRRWRRRFIPWAKGSLGKKQMATGSSRILSLRNLAWTKGSSGGLAVHGHRESGHGEHTRAKRSGPHTPPARQPHAAAFSRPHSSWRSCLSTALCCKPVLSKAHFHVSTHINNLSGLYMDLTFLSPRMTDWPA